MVLPIRLLPSTKDRRLSLMLGSAGRAGNSRSTSDRLLPGNVCDQGGSVNTDELTYGSYLRVPELLALQQPRSPGRPIPRSSTSSSSTRPWSCG